MDTRNKSQISMVEPQISYPLIRLDDVRKLICEMRVASAMR